MSPTGCPPMGLWFRVGRAPLEVWTLPEKWHHCHPPNMLGGVWIYVNLSSSLEKTKKFRSNERRFSSSTWPSPWHLQSSFLPLDKNRSGEMFRESSLHQSHIQFIIWIKFKSVGWLNIVTETGFHSFFGGVADQQKNAKDLFSKSVLGHPSHLCQLWLLPKRSSSSPPAEIEPTCNDGSSNKVRSAVRLFPSQSFSGMMSPKQ